MKLLALLFVTYSIFIIPSLAQPWAKGIGGTNNDQGRCIEVDESGNVYVTGYFKLTVDFDPGAGTTNLTSAGWDDVFFAKYNSSGALVWAKSVGGGSYDDKGRCIALDGSGNIYVSGSFAGTVDFDPDAGITNLTSAGDYDIFIAKYNSSGALIWAENVGGTNGDGPTGIEVDGNGNVYITGHFRGTADFDPGAGTVNLTSAGWEDVFFAKYNSSGAIVWAKGIGGTSHDYAKGIEVDGSGYIHLIGYFQGTADFDPNAGTTNLTSTGGADVFFARYNSSGSLVWARNIGGSDNDYGSSISLDGSGNMYITGVFMGTVDFNLGGGTANLASAGGQDVFFAKYGSYASFVWAKSVGGTSHDYGANIEVGGSGNVYITGYFQGTADFDPDGGTSNLTSAGVNDVFFAKYNSNGAIVWAKSVGGTSNDLVDGTALDGNNDVYITGYFQGTADFDPDGGTMNLISTGGSDVFFAKYDTDGALPVELSLFSAVVNNGVVILNWQTTTEVSNYGFDIERKVEGCSWEKISFVEGYGNSNSLKEYLFTDFGIEKAGTYYYRLKQIDIDGKFEYSDVVTIDIEIPTNYSIDQNYPNPFNPITTIKYQISEESFVALKVYDVLGNQIATLVNKEKPAGSYEVEFNAVTLPSGIYFYKLKAGNFVETKKMILLK